MRASFETDNLVPIVQHAKQIPIFLCVLLLSSHNSRLMKTEWLEGERSEMWKTNRNTHTWRDWWCGECKKRKKKRWRGGVENKRSMQLQLREQICAREYANSSFVWAVDWPLRCTPGGEGRGCSELGRFCLARRPSQASFSYTIAVSSIGGEKKTHFCQLPLRAAACTSKRCKESYPARIVIETENLHEYLAQLAGFRDGDRNKDAY